MATKKEEPKYIGRYGEVLEDVKEIERPKNSSKLMRLTGWGIDVKGIRRQVEFDVSRKTGKKCGFYYILRPKEEQNEDYHLLGIGCIEVCQYLNDLLHGDDTYYDMHGKERTIRFLRGRRLEGERLSSVCTDIRSTSIGEAEGEKRKNAARKSHDIRKLFSNTSVLEAIKTGNVLKVKSAMTRAIKKKEMGE